MDQQQPTPLIKLLRLLDAEQRKEFARLSGTRLTYLYALGGCSRRACRADKASAIETATRKLNGKYGTPIVTMHQLATMCRCAVV